MVTLERQHTGSQGTIGILTAGDFSCVTLEPEFPIPVGTYKVIWSNHPIHGMIYEIQNVPGHTGILIHSGNTVRDTHDCVLLGLDLAIFPSGTFPTINSQTSGITHSKVAVVNFEATMLLEPFVLEIT
jgi:hypothetical protein